MERRRWQMAVAAAAVVTSALVATGVASGLANYEYVRADGSVASSPAIAGTPGDDVTNLIVRGTDDGIYLSTSFFPGGGNPWESLGAPPGGAKGDPAIVSWGPGRLDIFVRGADAKLWQRFRLPNGVWSQWIRPLGDDGTLKSAPRASSRASGLLDVFVIGTDDHVYQRFFNGAQWNGAWLDQGEPAGPTGLVGDPATASADPAQVAVFARGTDNKLWGKTWNGLAWSDWAMVVPDGVLNSSPAAVRSGVGGIVVFVRGVDSFLYANELRGSTWRGWTLEAPTPNNQFQDSPSASIRPSGRIEAAVRGVNNLAYTYTYRLFPPAAP